MLTIIKSVTIRLRKRISNNHRTIRKELNLYLTIKIEIEYSIAKESSKKKSSNGLEEKRQLQM